MQTFDDLVSPVGLISNAEEVSSRVFPRQIRCSVASIGSGVFGHGEREVGHISGHGAAWLSSERARATAIGEAAERYAGFDNLAERRVWSPAEDMTGNLLDPARIPACSDAEYAHPDCPVSRFDPAAPIRWVSGLDLLAGEPIWVPGVMACYGMRDITKAESFTSRLSTGHAVYTDPVEAVVRGILEVVERDVISILWLQRLSLPLIDPADLDEQAGALVEWNRRRFVDTYVFDATSDLGVPAAYCVLAADHDRRASRAVGAAAGRTLTRAAAKALVEAVTVADLIHRHDERDVPDDLDRFEGIEDGPLYMGVSDRAGVFDFLLQGGHRGPTVTSRELPEDSDAALDDLLGRLAGAAMAPIVVDRTSNELGDVGLHAVSVIVPELQPLSLRPLAQFKGHPRLYRAPARMGYPTYAERHLNRWPQPFA